MSGKTGLGPQPEIGSPRDEFRLVFRRLVVSAAVAMSARDLARSWSIGRRAEPVYSIPRNDFAQAGLSTASAAAAGAGFAAPPGRGGGQVAVRLEPGRAQLYESNVPRERGVEPLE